MLHLSVDKYLRLQTQSVFFCVRKEKASTKSEHEFYKINLRNLRNLREYKNKGNPYFIQFERQILHSNYKMNSF
jgi:hypothetical protein